LRDLTPDHDRLTAADLFRSEQWQSGVDSQMVAAGSPRYSSEVRLEEIAIDVLVGRLWIVSVLPNDSAVIALRFERNASSSRLHG